MLCEAGYCYKLIECGGRIEVRSSSGKTACQYHPGTKLVQLIEPRYDFWISDHMDAARSIVAKKPIGVVKIGYETPERAEGRRKKRIKRISSQNSFAFDSEFELLNETAGSHGLSIRIGIIKSSSGKESKHVMVDSPSGDRLVNYWPSTMKIHDVAANKYSQAEQHGDMIRLALESPKYRNEPNSSSFCGVDEEFRNLAKRS